MISIENAELVLVSDAAVVPQLDVRRLEVAMHDAPLVCGIDRIGSLYRDARGVVDLHVTARESLREVLPLDHVRVEFAAMLLPETMR